MTRLAGAVRLEVKIQTRYGLWPVAGIITVLMTGLLVLAGPTAAPVVGPLILVVDTATFGVLFVAVLILFERTEGAFDAMRTSPLRPREYLATKIGLLTAMSVASAVPIGLAAIDGTDAGVRGLLLAVAGVGLLACFLLTSSAAMALPHRSLVDFVATGIWPLIPLLLAPIPHVLGLWTHALVYLIPSTGAAELIRAGIDPAVPLPGDWQMVGMVGYLLAGTAGAAWLARRTWSGHEPAADGSAPAPRKRAPTIRARAVSRSTVFGTHATLARLDATTIARDPMLLAVLVGPVALAAGLRFGYPAFEAFAHDAWGLALEPHRPLLAVVLVVLHVPYMVGSLTALLIAEDLDERHLLTLRVSPLSTTSYLAYRLGVATLLSLVLLAAATTIVGSDLLTWSLPLAGVLVLAATTGPLATLLVTAFTSNRVEALSLLKIVNLIPVGIPAAAWFLDEPIRWILTPVPYYWSSEATWGADTSGWAYPLAIVAGLCTTTAACVVLGRRTVHRITRT